MKNNHLLKTLKAALLVILAILVTSCESPVSTPAGTGGTTGQTFHPLDTNKNGYIDLAVSHSDPNAEIFPWSISQGISMDRYGDDLQVRTIQFRIDKIEAGMKFKIESDDIITNGGLNFALISSDDTDNFSITSKNVAIASNANSITVDMPVSKNMGYNMPVKPLDTHRAVSTHQDCNIVAVNANLLVLRHDSLGNGTYSWVWPK